MSKKVEKVQKGGRISEKNQKVQNSKFRLFDKKGGRYIFIFFPNVNVHFKYFSWRKNKLVLKWFLGNFKCFKLMFFFWGGPQNSKFSQFQIFPKLGPGGIIKFPIFPNCGLFPLFVIFFLEVSLMVLIAYTVTFWPISKTARLSQ